MSNVVVKLVDLPLEWMAIQAIRKIVFQDEQGVSWDLDFDGFDEVCDQLIASLDYKWVGTARIRYLDDESAKIERLAVLPLARGQGVGRKIMAKAMEVAALRNVAKVVIHAQEYVKGLYEQLGFEEVGEIFEEAGIDHVKMIKVLKT
ncbi:GNAT family N-acetyltransferase [Iningainema tapete]|uniref:GNAT family N-acetyltransferase n=1 Tax=Iningainema tapete BLCC-T55 TaxID=2748662 RepID=A0A8J7C0F7_9CYAN|nr:GNAT family N-acetyltransferase [Iningainema tapete]MBD2777948.1 GNAT family N-acetyltransferase [Iningainema tapete BLCC-T55]